LLLLSVVAGKEEQFCCLFAENGDSLAHWVTGSLGGEGKQPSVVE